MQWILGDRWAKACLKAGYLVDEEPYELIGNIALGISSCSLQSLAGEGEFTDNVPRKARMNLDKPRLLDGYSFYLHGTFSDIKKPDIIGLIEIAGGKSISLSHCKRKALERDGKTIILCDSKCTVGAFVAHLSTGADETVDAEKLEKQTGLQPLDVYWMYDSIAAHERLNEDLYLLSAEMQDDEGSQPMFS